MPMPQTVKTDNIRRFLRVSEAATYVVFVEYQDRQIEIARNRRLAGKKDLQPSSEPS